MKPRLFISRLVVVAMGSVLLNPGQARADLPLWTHTQMIFNTTGKPANDLHVNTVRNTVGAPPTAGPYFTTSAGLGTKNLDFGGGVVPAGGTTVVEWQSHAGADSLDPTDPGHWTFNGGDIGPVVIPPGIAVSHVTGFGGLVTIRVQNDTLNPINYSDLQIYKGADVTYFVPGSYLAGQTTGTAVPLLVAPSGSFAPGATDIATFLPSDAPTTYNSGSAFVAGALIGQGASAVPEPGPLLLVLLAGPGLYLAVRRHRPGHA